MDVEATRKAAGLSRKQLAEKAGVTESAVWSVEHGKNPRGGEEIRQKVLAALDPLATPVEPQVDAPVDTSEKPVRQLDGQPSGGRGNKRIVPPDPRPDWTIATTGTA
jgi:transcriptional regulator with XRE-family HTH domain